MRVYIAALCLVIMVLSGQWAYVLYIVATEGSYLMTEPKTIIIINELLLSMLIVAGAVFILIMSLRRRSND